MAQIAPLDVREGAASSRPVFVGAVGERLVFAADDGAGRGLYATDGLTLTRLAESGARYQGVRLGDDLYFFLCDVPRSCSLARTDGTVGGTALVADLPEFERLGYLAATSDRVFFLLRPFGRGETQLWTSDGTASGTRPVDGALPVVNDGIRYVVTAAEHRVFFSSTNGTELWVSGGEGAEQAAAFERPQQGGGFFYGTALGRDGQAFALVAEGDAQGLYAVDENGGHLIAPLPVGASNETLVPFGEGVLFGAYTSESGSPPRTVAFYAASANGVTRVSPDLPEIDLRDHAVVSPLGDGSVALAVVGGAVGGAAEVWRVAPGESARFAFRLPTGEEPYSRPGLFEVSHEARPAPAVVLVGGVLHALAVRDGTYSLWRDAGDGTARLVAEYRPEDLNEAPQFATAGGTVYVTFATPESGFEPFVLGRAATSVTLPPTAGPLAIEIEGVHPARDRARLRLTASTGERVRVEMVSALGRRVAVLLDGPAPAEPLDIDVSGLAPGVYVVRAAAGVRQATVRIVVAR